MACIYLIFHRTAKSMEITANSGPSKVAFEGRLRHSDATTAV